MSEKQKPKRELTQIQREKYIKKLSSRADKFRQLDKARALEEKVEKVNSLRDEDIKTKVELLKVNLRDSDDDPDDGQYDDDLSDAWFDTNANDSVYNPG